MKKLTQHDIICLHLEDVGDWVFSYNLSKANTKFGFLGSQGERRARELAEAGTHLLSEKIFTIERRQQGKYTQYRVLTTSKPRVQYVEKITPEGIVRVPVTM